jgi:hypothetical protein
MNNCSKSCFIDIQFKPFLVKQQALLIYFTKEYNDQHNILTERESLNHKWKYGSPKQPEQALSSESLQKHTSIR